MTTKSEFTPDELYKLWKAPYIAALAIMSAQPGGLAAEMIASVKAAIEARDTYHSELLQALLGIEQAEADAFGEKINAEAHSHGQITATDVLGMAITDIRAALSILRQKAQPEEIEEYKQMIMQRARSVANAASEGGFLGIGGVRVSEAEQRALDELYLAVNRQH